VLDDAGFPDAQILATGDLNEDKIRGLLDAGAAVDLLGVGTEMGVSYDAPAVGGVYKLVEDSRGYRIKLSTGKVTLPGRKQIWRITQNGLPVEDVIALYDEPGPPGGRLLLVEAMGGGRRMIDESLATIRARCRDGLATLPAAVGGHDDDESVYPVRCSPGLDALLRQMTAAPADR
jgi:nicotinate phosphoribosyltransferase